MIQRDSDNDGLWTGMHGAAACFAWATTGDPVARQRAERAFEALRFLSEVTQGGEHPAPLVDAPEQRHRLGFEPVG